MYMENVFACLQNNLTDGEEDLPEDSFSLLSVLLVGSLNFPFDRSRLAPRRQPSGRPFTRKLWSKLARCIPFLFHPLFHLLLSSVPLFLHAFRIFSRVDYNLFIFLSFSLTFRKNEISSDRFYIKHLWISLLLLLYGKKKRPIRSYIRCTSTQLFEGWVILFEQTPSILR